VLIVLSIFITPNVWQMAVIFGFFFWPGTARQVRSVVLSSRNRDYVAVARVRDAHLVPLKVAHTPGLARRDWVICMTHDDRGRAQPFAGVVEGELTQSKKPKNALVARVDVPARPGSPVLSTRGELIGVALDHGKRRTRAVAIETVVPFLRMVVLADGRDK
jgi:hypothetical protein